MGAGGPPEYAMDTGVGETYDITSINKALDDLGK
ncbi:hypothetical protein E2C01_025127 [Portunus trituberculatus]|uniref:Uncharacterized protein n=1 Tax=Portunus trituberculatus TaxID=210409 RepID=A0A5B7EER4_PORTR|nr:hypothetical protein [Portunus trituberculatus]